MSALKEWFMSHLDPGTRSTIHPIARDEKVNDWNLLLSSKREVKISDVVSNGPLILIFIRGTWCPFCQYHMKKLRDWTSTLKSKKASIIVVSSESVENIQQWLTNNPVSFMFASDPQYELSNYFGVRIPPRDFSQAATFLIDSDMSIRLAYSGKRGKRNKAAVMDALAD